MRMTPDELAEAILTAAGSSLRHYTPQARAEIIEAARTSQPDGGVVSQGTNGGYYPVRHQGMSLRDWLAGQALAGMMANCDGTGMNGWLGVQDLAAQYAYQQADAMIAARSNGGADNG